MTNTRFGMLSLTDDNRGIFHVFRVIAGLRICLETVRFLCVDPLPVSIVQYYFNVCIHAQLLQLNK